jgi:hypothetical protein
LSRSTLEIFPSVAGIAAALDLAEGKERARHATAVSTTDVDDLDAVFDEARI